MNKVPKHLKNLNLIHNFHKLYTPLQQRPAMDAFIRFRSAHSFLNNPEQFFSTTSTSRKCSLVTTAASAASSVMAEGETKNCVQQISPVKSGDAGGSGGLSSCPPCEPCNKVASKSKKSGGGRGGLFRLVISLLSLCIRFGTVAGCIMFTTTIGVWDNPATMEALLAKFSKLSDSISMTNAADMIPRKPSKA